MGEKPDFCLLADAKYSESVKVLNLMKVNPTCLNCASKNFESQRDINEVYCTEEKGSRLLLRIVLPFTHEADFIIFGIEVCSGYKGFFTRPVTIPRKAMHNKMWK